MLGWVGLVRILSTRSCSYLDMIWRLISSVLAVFSGKAQLLAAACYACRLHVEQLHVSVLLLDRSQEWLLWVARAALYLCTCAHTMSTSDCPAAARCMRAAAVLLTHAYQASRRAAQHVRFQVGSVQKRTSLARTADKKLCSYDLT
jgi:hypothetical protein